MKHFKITFKPDDRQITIRKGATLFEAAGQAGIILNTACGGRGICGKCEAVLEVGGEKVLSCQYRIERDLTVTIPVSSRFFEQKILAEGIETAGVQPDIYENYLEIQPEEPILGVAVDIGTTTVVARLINMADGHCLATKAAWLVRPPRREPVRFDKDV